MNQPLDIRLRRATIFISPETIWKQFLLTVQEEVFHQAHLAGVWYDHDRGKFGIALRHASFPTVEDGYESTKMVPTMVVGNPALKALHEIVSVDTFDVEKALETVREIAAKAIKKYEH